MPAIYLLDSSSTAVKLSYYDLSQVLITGGLHKCAALISEDQIVGVQGSI